MGEIAVDEEDYIFEDPDWKKKCKYRVTKETRTKISVGNKSEREAQKPANPANSCAEW